MLKKRKKKKKKWSTYLVIQATFVRTKHNCVGGFVMEQCLNKIYLQSANSDALEYKEISTN